MMRYAVDVTVHSTTRVVVEADTPEQAAHLVGEIDATDLGRLVVHESTVHDRDVCAATVRDYRRVDVFIGEATEDDEGVLS